MTIIRRIDYSSNKAIGAIVIDSTKKSLWIAYKKNLSNKCLLKRVSAFNPNQLYYSIEIEVDEIKKLTISGDYIYCAYEDSALIGARYSTSNPLTTSTDFSIPSGITEAPVDVLVSNSDLWYLIPGTATGENAKLIKFSTTGTYDETIDLSETGNIITNAVSLTEDTGTGDLYIVTNNSPSELVRVYQTTGGSYEWEVTSLS